ncbi:MAG: hypothetical protein WBB35_15320 [Saprospiraceae bacterium]
MKAYLNLVVLLPSIHYFTFIQVKIRNAAIQISQNQNLTSLVSKNKLPSEFHLFLFILSTVYPKTGVL